MSKKKDYNYFEAFVHQGNFALEAAELLKSSFKNFTSIDVTKRAEEMHTIEHSADIAKHEMQNRLLKEFLPPIEREDIMSISQKIDDVTDAVEDVFVCVDMFNIKVIDPELMEFTDIIVDCCKAMNVALVELQNFKRSKTLREKIIEINRLEESGDSLYISAVRKLYQTSKDPIRLMVLTEILRRMEKCCDTCEDVADDIESIVLKNS